MTAPAKSMKRAALSFKVVYDTDPATGRNRASVRFRSQGKYQSVYLDLGEATDLLEVLRDKVLVTLEALG